MSLYPLPEHPLIARALRTGYPYPSSLPDCPLCGGAMPEDGPGRWLRGVEVCEDCYWENWESFDREGDEADAGAF